MDTASIVSSQCSEISTASVPLPGHRHGQRRGHHLPHPQQPDVPRRHHPEVGVRRSGSRHQLPARPKSLSMSIHTVQFEKGMMLLKLILMRQRRMIEGINIGAELFFILFMIYIIMAFGRQNQDFKLFLN